MLYSIEPYNPAWINKFNTTKSLLEKIFGPKVAAIEHIGSTSVPGIKAKPIIDILVLVEKIEPFTAEKETMTGLGYEHKDNYVVPDSILFYRTANNEKIDNIHVLAKDSIKAKELLATRDYLRSHPEKAREYEKLKEKLHDQSPDDYIAYREGKAKFLKELNKLALEWESSKQELAREVNAKLREWSSGKDKLVAAIDGYTGVGKTTLLENLAKINPEILPAHTDDFFVDSQTFHENWDRAKAAGDASRAFKLEQYDLNAIRNFVEDFRRDKDARKILVIEGVFMLHDRIRNLWDKTIYLNGDEAEIDKRRVAREKARWGEKYRPETDPDSQFRQVIIALKRYGEQYKPEDQADLVLKTS